MTSLVLDSPAHPGGGPGGGVARGASGALASRESSSTTTPTRRSSSWVTGRWPGGGRTVAGASFESGFDYAAPERIQLGYGPGGPAAIRTLADLVVEPGRRPPPPFQVGTGGGAPPGLVHR